MIDSKFQIDTKPLLKHDELLEEGEEFNENQMEEPFEPHMNRKRIIGLILGFVLFFVFLIVFNNVSDDAKYAEVNETLAVLFLMVTWWLCEVVDVATTALLPLNTCTITGSEVIYSIKSLKKGLSL